MRNFNEFITNRETVSDNDMDALSDDYMEDEEQEEVKIEHLNLEEERDNLFGDDFLFAASNVKVRGSCRKYTTKQVDKLFDLIIEEGFTTKAAALAAWINIRTAQNYVEVYNSDFER